MAFDNKYLQGNEFTPGTDWITIGVYLRFTTIQPGQSFHFFRVSRSAAGAYHLAILMTSSEPGRMQILQADGSSAFLSGRDFLEADRWYLFELKFKKTDSSDFRFWLDGSLIVSSSGNDFNDGASAGRVEIRTQAGSISPTPASPRCTVYCGSWYVRTDDGANIDTNDTRLGPYTVLGPFNWSQSGTAPDFGPTSLNAGVWDDTKEVPLNDANYAQYSGGGMSKEGGVTAHDGAKPGPKGSESIIDGTIEAVNWGWRAKKSSAVATQKFKGKYGKTTVATTDNTVKTANRTLTTSWKNWWIIEDAAGANAPTITDWFQIGMEKTQNFSSSHLQMGEIWTFILHREPPGGAMPMAMDHYRRMRTA